MPKVTNVKLSELGFVDIEYIPLESNEQSMISGTDNLYVRNNIAFGESNFLFQRFSTILEFSTDGRFITRIGTKRRGPNEFSAAHDVNINRTNNEIFLLARWQKKFLVYSANGDIIRTIPIFNLLMIKYYATVCPRV